VKKIALLLLLIPLSAWVVCAYDVGVLLDQTLGVGGVGDDADADYSIAAIPYFSSPLGDSGDAFVSAGISAGYENEEGFFVPELLRSEITWRFSDALRVRAGRLSYADPLNFVVDGLLDGAQVLFNSEVGTFNAGILYSGLLYKKTTRILMSWEDFSSYYDDNYLRGGTYGASRRLLTAVGWQHPALMELVQIGASFTAQFDVNGKDDPYHSQYITVKAGMPFEQFAFELGGALELAQDADEKGAALAGEIGASWDPPLIFKSRLSFNGKFTTGRADNDSVFAFVPITIQEQGYVLQARLSGLSVFGLDYTARILNELSSGVSFMYFARNDLESYFGYPAGFSEDDDKVYALGAELFGRVTWGPTSDLRLNAGIGVFLPGMGNVAPDADPQWRIEFNVIVVCY